MPRRLLMATSQMDADDTNTRSAAAMVLRVLAFSSGLPITAHK